METLHHSKLQQVLPGRNGEDNMDYLSAYAGQLRLVYEPTVCFDKIKIITAQEVVTKLCPSTFPDLMIQEHFVAYYFDRAMYYIGYQIISSGGIAGTVVSFHKVLSMALLTLASSIIIVHNHPSNNIKPSNEDINISKKLRAAANYHDIVLLDSIIIGTNFNNYTSLEDEALIA